MVQSQASAFGIVSRQPTADHASASSCRGSWQPLANTEAYMNMNPLEFNQEVRRRATDWRREQEKHFAAQAAAVNKERVKAERTAYLRRMGIVDTRNPILRGLKVNTCMNTHIVGQVMVAEGRCEADQQGRLLVQYTDNIIMAAIGAVMNVS